MSRQMSVRMTVPQMWATAATLLNRINRKPKEELLHEERVVLRMCERAYARLMARLDKPVKKAGGRPFQKRAINVGQA